MTALLLGAAPAAAEAVASTPLVVLETPADGAVFYQGQDVQAAYACFPGDLGWPVVSCLGDLPLGAPLETDSVGAHSFSVRAEDYAGEATTITHSYTVLDVIAPAIMIAAPAREASYPFGATVTVDYECDDGPGGSTIVACIGTLPSGAELPTDQLGSFEFEVTAVDGAGNVATSRHRYQVVDLEPPTVSIIRPEAPLGDRLPTYVLGQLVHADFSCSDGAGIGACSGSVPSGWPLDTASVGIHRFSVLAKDLARNVTTATRSYRVVYAFDGFAPPLAPTPELASVKAGQDVPVKFSLSGDFGLGVVTAVDSEPMACSSGVAIGELTAASGTLAYGAGADRYTFRWQSDRAWLDHCRRLSLTLADGTIHQANVRFVK